MNTKVIKPLQNKVWLASPCMHGDELKYMKLAYDTNWMSTVGENINVVEAELEKLVDRRYGVALSSGTAALHMAVRLAGEKLYGKRCLRGKKAACSDMTFAATVNPVKYEGMVPVFIDTEYDTWNMDPAALEKALTEHEDIKIVVLAHLYGTPAKADEITDICKRHGSLLIEDAAESLGATYKGKQTGSFGDISCISFNGNKIITGSAGGMLLTDNEEDAVKVKKWSTQSRELAPWYQHEEVGYNYRMSNVIAGVVRGQIPHLHEHIEKKKKIFEAYTEGFKGLPVSMNPIDTEDMIPNYWLSCLLIDKGAMCLQQRGETTAKYMAEAGKSCPTEILEALTKLNAEGRPIWKPMHMQPMYKENVFVKAGDIDVGADIFDRGLCLPSDINMTVKHQKIILETIRNCFK